MQNTKLRTGQEHSNAGMNSIRSLTLTYTSQVDTKKTQYENTNTRAQNAPVSDVLGSDVEAVTFSISNTAAKNAKFHYVRYSSMKIEPPINETKIE